MSLSKLDDWLWKVLFTLWYNSGHPGFLKRGQTGKGIEIIGIKLRLTGMFKKFVIEYLALASDYRVLTKYIHRKLNNAYLSKGKEPYKNFRINEHL